MTEAQLAYGTAAATLIRLVIEDELIQALWLEGPDRAALRPPYDGLEAHLATDDPRFAPMFERRGELLGAIGATETEVGDAPRDGKVCRGTLPGGHPFELQFERLALIAKRSRAGVKPLVDKTGELRHVLDYGGAEIADRLG